MKIKAIFLVLFSCLCLFACSDGISQPKTPQAINYKQLLSEKGKIGSASLFERHISLAVPPEQYESVTQEQIAQTAMKAAWDVYEESKPNIVVIWVQMNKALIGTGSVAGKAVFIPDAKSKGKDIHTWEVQAVKKLPSAQQLAIETLWWQLRDGYQIPDGYGGTMTDEAELKGVIAEQLDIPTDNIHLSSFMMDGYYKQ